MKIPKYKFVFDRRKTATSTKKSAVEFVITYNYQQKFISTGLMLYAGEWNPKNSKVIRCEGVIAKNQMLSEYMEKAESIIFDMVKRESVDLELFARMMMNKNDKIPTFFNYVRARAIDKPVRDTTKKRYSSFLSVLSEFVDELSFAEINVRFIKRYDEWLHKRNIGSEKEPKYMKQGSIATHHKYMKQFIADAIIDGYMKVNPYHDRSINIEKGDKEYVDYLTEKQLAKMTNLSLSENYLVKTRDLFLIQSYTGLGFSDLMAFDFDKAFKVDSGKFLYIGRRIKTGVEFMIILLPEALKILKRYNNKVPQITNQKYNEYLKIIGMMIGVPGLHSHQARGTFATIAINRGVSLDILKKILGHTKTIQTAKYASVLQSSIEKEMEKMN